MCVVRTYFLCHIVNGKEIGYSLYSIMTTCLEIFATSLAHPARGSRWHPLHQFRSRSYRCVTHQRWHFALALSPVRSAHRVIPTRRRWQRRCAAGQRWLPALARSSACSQHSPHDHRERWRDLWGNARWQCRRPTGQQRLRALALQRGRGGSSVDHGRSGSGVSRFTSRWYSCTAGQRWLRTWALYNASSRYAIATAHGGWSRIDRLARWQHRCLTRRR